MLELDIELRRGTFQRHVRIKDDARVIALDPATGAYHDAYYGWLYDAAANCLVDEATGNKYDMSYQPLQ